MRPSFATLASMVSLSVCGLAVHPVRAESATDMIEHFFGASNVNAQAGNGGLTIGISSLGDLSVLTWPSPSYTDQVLHVASNALDVREQRQMMLDDSMGATVGFAIATADGSGFTWLREAGWTVTQGYGDPEAAVEAGLMAMVERVATPDTAILGETFVAVDTDGDGTNDAFSSRVSNPHLWAATLVYLTAMALYNPERFDPHLEVLPPLVEPGQDREGCGCEAAAQEPPPVLLLLLLGLLWRRKRKWKTPTSLHAPGAGRATPRPWPDGHRPRRCISPSCPPARRG